MKQEEILCPTCGAVVTVTTPDNAQVVGWSSKEKTKYFGVIRTHNNNVSFGYI